MHVVRALSSVRRNRTTDRAFLFDTRFLSIIREAFPLTFDSSSRRTDIQHQKSERESSQRQLRFHLPTPLCDRLGPAIALLHCAVIIRSLSSKSLFFLREQRNYEDTSPNTSECAVSRQEEIETSSGDRQQPPLRVESARGSCGSANYGKSTASSSTADKKKTARRTARRVAQAVGRTN